MTLTIIQSSNIKNQNIENNVFKCIGLHLKQINNMQNKDNEAINESPCICIYTYTKTKENGL